MTGELTRYFDECKARIDKIFDEPAKYGYESNFLDKERGAKWEDFTPAHQATLIDRFAFVYAANIDEIHREKAKNKDFDVVAYVAEKSVPLGEAGTEAEKQNLFRDKLMSRDGFILEMPGVSAAVTKTEIENRAEIFEAIGLDPEKVTLRNKVGHSTYDQVVAEVNGKSVAVKDIIGGALQGVHRKLEPKDQVTLMRESISKAIESESDEGKLAYLRESLAELEGKKDVRGFNAGSQVFIPKEDAGKASDIVGSELLTAGREIHHANTTDTSPSFKGFTAGVSGNAMHYALSGLEFSRQVLGKEMSASEKEAMYKVVEKHLVGTDQAPLHHSTPETKLGFELGVGFANVAKTGERLAEVSLNQTVSDARVVTHNYVAEVKAQKSSPTIITVDSMGEILKAASVNSPRSSQPVVAKHVEKIIKL